MIWDGIYSDKLTKPYEVDDGEKLTMNRQSYYEFLGKTFVM